jgi:serine/threonine protein kinase
MPKPGLPLAEELIGGRFRPVRLIKKATVCDVWLARDAESDQLVALKRLRSQYLGNPRSRLSMELEAAALAMIRHEGVPRMHCSAFTGTEPFIAMDYIDGGPFTGNNLMMRSNALRAGIDLCGMLSCIHGLGIVHRDIKPSNVLVPKPSGIPKLIDFGIARVPGKPDLAMLSGGFIGHADFIAPEQTYPMQNLDFRADLYSLALMLYIVVARRYPYRIKSETTECHLEAHRSGRLLSLHKRDRSVPQSLDIFFERAMAKDPRQRFQSAEEMADALTEELERCLRAWEG